ncbi:2-oxoacid dehydrogenases acyltransferase-domain-containing protein [Blastocladiella britannica]|nr:2-oxoacid dehydrogenases acyltransferase-domain-containing protein [Blastocladiella britannica]
MCRAAAPASAPASGIVPFLLADIGEGITECEITQWYLFVKEGDEIAQFDKICEVQSDKAAVEISSRFDGKIAKLYYKIGDMAKVGAPLVDIAVEGDDAVAEAAPSAAAPAAAPTPVATPAAAVAATPVAAAVVDSDRVVFATPAVRRLAREHNLDLRQVPATGKGDRILKEDVLRFMDSSSVPPAKPAAARSAPIAAPVAATPVSVSSAADELRPLTAIQKAMFKQMTKSLTIPHFGYADEIRMDALTQLRSHVNASLHKSPKGTHPFSKVSYMPFLMKSFSLALQQFPLLNSQLVLDPTNADPATAFASAKMLYRTRHNISIAMDTPNGLIVPNIKDVQSKTVLEIAADLHRLQEAGKKSSIAAADLQGGTITLSNIGAVGGTYMGPVVVTSEVCIVALGKTARVPRFKGDSDVVEAHNIMPVSFAADHRVVDGASVARFVQLWKSYIESPMTMLAQLK